MTRANPPIAALAAAFLGVVACTHGDASSDIPASPPSPSSAVAPAAAATAATGAAAPATTELETTTRGWELHSTYTYALTSVTTLSLADKGQGVDVQLRGTLHVTPTVKTPESVTLYASIPDTKIGTRVPKSQPQMDKVAAELRANGCFFRFAGGLLIEMSIANGASPMAANVYRQIASALQFVRPRREAEQYTAEEYDTTGRYLAEYSKRDGPLSWNKNKKRYVGLLTPTARTGNIPVRVLPQLVDSRGTVQLSPEGRPEVVQLHEELLIQEAQQPVRSTADLSLSGGPPEAAELPETDWSSLLSVTSPLKAQEPYVAAGAEDSLDKARMQGMTYETVVSKLEEIARNSEKSTGGDHTPSDAAQRDRDLPDESKLFTALAAILRTNPRAVPLTVQKIHAKSPARHILVDALASASSPAALSALAALMNDKTVDEGLRKQALTAMARAPKPRDASIDAFETLLETDPFNAGAIYGLGTFSRRLRDAGKTAESARLGEILLGRLALAGDAGQRAIALRGIANSGYAAGLPKIVPFLTSAEEQVRVAAVRALQSMNDPQVDPLIASSLESDPSVEVRISAIEAARVRQPSDRLVRALGTAATAADDAHVRYRAVELMSIWLPRRGELRPVLQQVAQTDGEPQVRDRAKAAL